jgi:hypothetical protein
MFRGIITFPVYLNPKKSLWTLSYSRIYWNSRASFPLSTIFFHSENHKLLSTFRLRNPILRAWCMASAFENKQDARLDGNPSPLLHPITSSPSDYISTSEAAPPPPATSTLNCSVCRNVVLKYTAPWNTTLLTSCNWEKMTNGADKFCLLQTNHKQAPTHVLHCSPCNIMLSNGSHINYFTPNVIGHQVYWFIGKICMRLAASGAAIAVKSRAMEPVNNVKKTVS